MRSRPIMGELIGGLLLMGALVPGAQGETPRALWEDRVVSAPMVAPALSGDTLWVTGTNRKIHSLDARTGKRHWKRTMPAHAVLPPVPAGELLIVGLGAPRPAILLLDRQSGKEQSRIPLDARPVEILRAGGSVLFATFRGTVGARNLGDGSVLWNRDLDAAIAGGASAGESFFVLGRSDSLWCLDPFDGRRLWAVAVEGTHSAGPIVVDSVLLRVSYEGALVEHDLDTGRLLATRSVSSPQVSRPAYADGRVATVAVGGEVEIFDLSFGEERSLIDTGETIASGGCAWGTWWVVPTLTGRVLAVRRSRGAVEWSLTFRDPISFPPASSASYLSLINDRGRMVVYERGNPS